MRKKIEQNPADFIQPLVMNGLEGRMLHMPAPKGRTREILFVYGHHASIERQFGVLQVLNRYGAVTLPDLPGFGGMEPFYSIGVKPTIDNLADYLAAFIKMRYKRKKVTIVAMSLGFAITTRMLQRFPELTKKVNLLVSVVGFVHHDEFIFQKSTALLFTGLGTVFSRRIPAFVAKHVFLRPGIIRLAYALVADNHVKMRDADAVERKKRIDFEIELWRCNDIRTYMQTGLGMLSLDLIGERVDLPLHHISVGEDRYFDHHVVEQHLNIIFNKVSVIRSAFEQHGPTVIADEVAADAFVPPQLKRLLARKPR